MSSTTSRGPARTASGNMKKVQTDMESAAAVTPEPPVETDSSAKSRDNGFMNGFTNKLLQKYPVLAQWKTRRAFVTAQYQVFGILAIAFVMNKWPVSYPRDQNHNEMMFWVMVAALGAASYYTVKHEKGTRGVRFLSRDQTEEWKGWMQFIFIMYHYYRNWSIYNEIRVLVSAYVWMTGFGNFLYFEKTQDFSLERMVSMWLRINYFPLMLSIFLSVKLELYYVVPLHTVGFFMTMATCYIAKLLREKFPQKLDQFKSNLAAIGLSLLVHIIFFETSMSGLLTWFSPEYEFRFQTDKYSAWFGMVCGFMWGRLHSYMQWCYGEEEAGASVSSGDAEEQKEQQGKTQKPQNPKKQQAVYIQRGVGAALLLTWYFAFGSTHDKHAYNPQHPYIFWMPIAGWLMLRNSSKYLTEMHSTVLEFMGRITLETYVLQFHVFMCRSVQHIPVVIPGSGVNGFAILKLANMLVTGAGFFALAWYARQATIVTQESVTELVGDLKKKVKFCGGSSSSRDEGLMMTKPTLGIIDDHDDTTPLTTPQKDKKNDEA